MKELWRENSKLKMRFYEVLIEFVKSVKTFASQQNNILCI